MDKKRGNWIRRALASALALAMCLAVLPVDAMAGGTERILADGNPVVSDDGIMAMSVEAVGTAPAGSKAEFGLMAGADGLIPGAMEDGVFVYDIGNAKNRASLRYCYAYVAITVTTGGEDEIPAHTVRIELPDALSTARNGETHAHPFDMSKNDFGDAWSAVKSGGKVVIENVKPVGVNSHGSMTVAYELDCWHIPSMEAFEIPCDASFNGGAASRTVLRAAVRTGVRASSDAWWPFENMDGVNFSDAYVDEYVTSFGSIGLSKETFLAATGADKDNPDYVFDIMEMDVAPRLQQPYGIEGLFIPGSYHGSNGLEGSPGSGWMMRSSVTTPTGWDGELVAACIASCSKTLSMSKVYPMEIGPRTELPYEDLPGAYTGPEYAENEYVKAASAHRWNSYAFSMPYDTLAKNGLPVLSLFSDGPSTRGDYRLLFVVKYPNKAGTSRDGTCSIDVGQGAAGSEKKLSATVKLEHVGVDDGARSGYVDVQCLYKGRTDRVDYEGDIYWTTYIENASDVEVPKGLTSLLLGRDESYKLTADWYCFNGNRASMAEDDRYTLEAIVDVGFLGTTSGSDDGVSMLGPDDYRIKSYGFVVADAEDVGGVAYEVKNGSHAVVGTEGYLFDDSIRTVPAWASGETVTVYGSESLSGDEWIQLEQVKLSDVWPKSNYWSSTGRSVKVGTKAVPGGYDGIVRLKVVYPGSRDTTVIRMTYEVELKHDGGSVGDFVSGVGDAMDVSANLTHWCNYTAYESEAYASHYATGTIVPDLQTKYGDVHAEATGTMVREFDAEHPYPGYGSSADIDVFPMRNFMDVSLKTEPDTVGMMVTQYLYNKNGSIIGDPNTGSSDVYGYVGKDAATMHDVSPGVSKVKYTLAGVVGTKASTPESFSSAMADAKGIASPLSCTTSRYYALLPDGFHYVDGSLSRAGVSSWQRMALSASNVPNIEPSVRYSSGTKMTSVTWRNVVNPGTVDVRTYDLGGRQLVVFDVPAYYPSGESGLNYAWPGDYYWTDAQHDQYFHATPIAFDVAPDDPDETVMGTYDAVFFHQFLNKAPDGTFSAVSMDGYEGSKYSSVEEVIGAGWGSDVDGHVVTGARNSLLSIGTSFRTFSGAGMTYGGLRVKAGGKDDGGSYATKAVGEPGGEYTYALSYGVAQSTSTDVVLWDSIEGYGRTPQDWHGKLKSFDTNGIEGVAVYVNEASVDIREYLDGGADSSWLTAGNGWVLADGVEDLGEYRSIAFWFGDKTFDASGKNDPSGATVYVTMEIPDGTSPEFAGRNGPAFTYNEMIFSDEHGETKSVGTVLGNHVQVEVPFDDPVAPEGGYEMPNTGGAGTGIHLMSGACLLLASLWLYGRRRRA